MDISQQQPAQAAAADQFGEQPLQKTVYVCGCK